MGTDCAVAPGGLAAWEWLGAAFPPSLVIFRGSKGHHGASRLHKAWHTPLGTPSPLPDPQEGGQDGSTAKGQGLHWGCALRS